MEKAEVGAGGQWRPHGDTILPFPSLLEAESTLWVEAPWLSFSGQWLPISDLISFSSHDNSDYTTPTQATQND